ncbi:hypothetical protein DFP74_0969 [Nocardiopsis sp. Huas11]|nr:hypothetical protein DFP74_0969 [Nocardiopsis sp. Huas11]
MSSDPRHGFGGHPGMSNPRPGTPGMPGVPGAPGGYPQQRPAPHVAPHAGNPLATGMNPNQTFSRPGMPQPMPRPVEQESVLQQSWVIPAVLITIVILVLVILIIALS